MRNALLLASLFIVFALAGCETPTQAYVKQHPELPPQYKKIILSGRIKYGDPVAGMTREQVRLIMGTDPDQFDSVNGEDTWTWFHSKAPHTAFASTSTDADTGGSARQGGGGKHNKPETDDSAATEIKPGKTTVFFKGNLVTHVQFGGGTL